MQRKLITLSKETVLWEAGDAARGIGILEKGKLGVKTEKGLVGVMLPHMVLGESALLGSREAPDQRTVTIIALEDETMVTEYPIAEVKTDFEGGSEDLMRHVIVNQVAQISRNLLMVIATRRGQALLDEPLNGLVRGLIADVPKVSPLRGWDDAVATCRFLHDLRSMSDRLLDQMGPKPGQRAEMIVNVSQSLAQLSMGKDVRPIVEAFMEAERQKTEWWSREDGH